MFCAGEAIIATCAVVLDQVLNAGVVAGAIVDAMHLRRLGQRGGWLHGMTIGIVAGARCHAMDRVTHWLCIAGFVCTLGSGWGCGFTLGVALGKADADGAVMEVAVRWRRCTKISLMLVLGAVMPFRAWEQLTNACMSLSAGVMMGLVIVLCWNAMVSLSH